MLQIQYTYTLSVILASSMTKNYKIKTQLQLLQSKDCIRLLNDFVTFLRIIMSIYL